MASFDRTIPPGGEGKISLVLNTKGYQGSVYETAVVHTNDPKAETLTIGLRVFVEVPIVMNPRYLLFTGVEGRIDTKSIEIIAALDEPLELTPEGFNLEGKMSYRIEEVEKSRKFRVHLTNHQDASGIFRGFLNLRTNYQEMPVLNIRIGARFLKP